MYPNDQPLAKVINKAWLRHSKKRGSNQEEMPVVVKLQEGSKEKVRILIYNDSEANIYVESHMLFNPILWFCFRGKYIYEMSLEQKAALGQWFDKNGYGLKAMVYDWRTGKYYQDPAVKSSVIVI